MKENEIAEQTIAQASDFEVKKDILEGLSGT